MEIWPIPIVPGPVLKCSCFYFAMPVRLE